MKTLNGDAIVKDRIEQILAKYPADSLSPREVIMTVPMDYDEEKIQSLNAAITKTIYQQTEDYIKSLPPKQRGFQVLPKSISYDDQKAAQEAYKIKITQAVVDAVYSTISAEK